MLTSFHFEFADTQTYWSAIVLLLSNSFSDSDIIQFKR